MWESDPPFHFGKVKLYRLTNPALAVYFNKFFYDKIPKLKKNKEFHNYGSLTMGFCLPSGEKIEADVEHLAEVWGTYWEEWRLYNKQQIPIKNGDSIISNKFRSKRKKMLK